MLSRNNDIVPRSLYNTKPLVGYVASELLIKIDERVRARADLVEVFLSIRLVAELELMPRTTTQSCHIFPR